MIYAVSKNNAKVSQQLIQRYTGTGIYSTVPYLVKINENKFLVIWQEENIQNNSDWRSKINGNVKYAIVDSQGQITKAVTTLENYMLSKCQPAYIDGKVVWPVQMSGYITFYYLPVN